MIRPRRCRAERGAVAVLTAVLAIVLFTMAALVVDLGHARDVRRQSQNAVDASALAGASVLYPDGACSTGAASPCIGDAVAAVKRYAAENFAVTATDWATCTVDAAHPALGYVPAGESRCISLDSSTSPRRVRVYLPSRTVKFGLATVIGASSVDIRSFAEAKLGEDVVCTLCFLGPVDAGNADFTVTGGAIAVNGDATGGPNSNWSATSIGVVGTAEAGEFVPTVTKIDPFTDPLATTLSLPPTTTELPAGRTDPCNGPEQGGGPGVYTSEVEIPKTTCTLQPGLYVITNAWTMKNNSMLKGAGVTLYVKKPGSLDFKNGEVDITAPSTGPLAGFAIVYDRDNFNNLGLQGNGETSIVGGVYAPASALDFNGNSCFGFRRGPVVVNGVIKANGNKSCVTITNASDATIAKSPSHLNQ